MKEQCVNISAQMREKEKVLEKINTKVGKVVIVNQTEEE